MSYGCGVLNWSADQVRRATFFEMSCAYIGHCQYHGEGMFRRDPNGFCAAEIDDFKAEIAALQARFPDGHKSHYRKQRDKLMDRGEVSAIKPAKRSKAKKRALRDGRHTD